MASAIADSKPRSLFLRLPTEIRLMIYELLLVPSSTTIATNASTIACPGYHEYEQSSPRTPDSIPTLTFRSIDQKHYQQSLLLSAETQSFPRLRSAYTIRDRFRGFCSATTYNLTSNPGIHAAILSVNRQIHDEAAEMLYGAYQFDFDTHIEAIAPFLNDLTAFSRSCIKRVSLVKRALPYDKDFDRCEWRSVCQYLSNPAENHIAPTHLSLGVVAGKPGPDGWDDVRSFTSEEFRWIAELDTMEWIKVLMAVKSLKSLDVRACVEHCPPPMSNAMAEYVAFSASIDGGFAEYIKAEMLMQ
ncbi:hypothetical protein B0A49_09618 [Cryomyces minteri]|uniref:2EXR domain-containing protein n=1 Tax=Cryomyces minteri TaxID=331657 RepID=A0A4U0WE95_9PEZI|nr:hypothetical protein B0A49_09618 [Cryomyces minteri]